MADVITAICAKDRSVHQRSTSANTGSSCSSLLLANHTPIHTHSHNTSPSPLTPIFYSTSTVHLYTHHKHTYLISHSLSSLPHGY